MVTFTTIPATTLVPFVWMEFDASKARPTPTIQPYKLLCIGSRITAGTVAELVPKIVRNASEAAGFFGAGSELAVLLAGVFENQTSVEVTAIAIDDDAGATSATGTQTIVGTATAAGTIFLYVGGRRYAVGVSSGDDVTAQGDAVAAAVNADGLALVTATNVVGVVTFEAKNGGTLGNSIDVRLNYFEGETEPAGSVSTIAPIGTVIPGATDPDIDEVWPLLADVHYNAMAVAYTDSANLAALDAELESRFLPNRAIDSVAILAIQDTHANLVTLGDGRNDKFTTLLGFDAGLEPAWQWAGAIAAQVVASSSLDPALPFQTLKLIGIKAPVPQRVFTLQEKEALLIDGIAVFNATQAGAVAIGRLVTLYQLDDQSNPSDTFRDLNTPLTLGYFRWSMRNGLQSAFARHKLVDDGVQRPAGQRIVTPTLFKAQVVAIARGWFDRGLLEDLEAFKAAIVVERDVTQDPNRLDLLISPNLVNQFRVARISTQFIL